jgi:transcriptional regulator with XRE-family HTH domain
MARSTPRQNGFTIRALRKRAGISTEDMARRLDILPSTYRRLEDETRAASEEHLKRIATALDMPVPALVRTPPGGSVSAGRETVRA